MYSAKSFQLTTEEYNYLLPVLRHKLTCSNDKYLFVGTLECLEDMLNRLKGLYDYYNDIKSFTIYKCSKDRTLEYFRNEVTLKNS